MTNPRWADTVPTGDDDAPRLMSIAVPAPIVRGDRYVVLRRLARGGMSELWLARDSCLDRRVVLKEARADLDDGAGRVCRASVEREAPILASLDHPCIVPIYDVYEHDGGTGLVLPFVDGARLDEVPDLPTTFVLALARRIAGALAHIHRRGVVHLDLKVENVLLTPRGTPCILDFGIAQAPGRVWQLPDARGVPGTPRLMPPEQARGGDVDGRSDLFALGVLLFELLAGVSPFLPETSPRTAPRLDALVPSVPAEVATLVGELLAADADQRPGDASEVEARLARISPA
jgi:serine/threonine-protein kinase